MQAHVNIIVRRIGVTHAKRSVERLALRRLHIGQPVGHGNHAADTRITNGRRCPERIAVKSVELAFKTDVPGGFDQQGQVVAEVACQHGIGPAGLDFGGIGRKVFHTLQRVQFVAHNLHVGPHITKLAFGLAQHGLAKAVVLPDQIHRFDRRIVFEHRHQRGHAHVGMGIKPKVPEAAFLIGENRIHRRIVKEQHAPAGLAFVVLVDGVDQRGSNG